jgi:hypothetical protein
MRMWLSGRALVLHMQGPGFQLQYVKKKKRIRKKRKEEREEKRKEGRRGGHTQ